MSAKNILRRIAWHARSWRSRWLRPRKVFCIGRNKTGTTSLARALHQLGYHVAPQGPAELLLDDWSRGDFDRLFEFCRWYDAFQDIPFSLATTYEHLDRAFPGSKFILSVRDSADQWYESMVRFQSQKFGRDGALPTWGDLESSEHRAPGYLAKVQRLVYGVDGEQLYDRRRYIEHYNEYNAAVRAYFSERPTDLLEINLAAMGAYPAFCRFLGKAPLGSEFPWENASRAGGSGAARTCPTTNR